MANTQEKVPLLSSPSSQENNPSLFPPLGSNNLSLDKQNQQASFYGVVEITPSQSDIQLETRERKLRQPGGFASAPIIAIVAVVAGIVLIFTFAATNTTQGHIQKLKSVIPLSVQPRGRLAQSQPYADIEIPQGRLRGYTKQSRQGRDYSAFYKVPYAEPPLGNLRFKDPLPPSPWEGLRDNPVVAPQCIQKEKYSDIEHAVGEEDCLYANVYTPRLPEGQDDTSELFPIMIYIHGGGTTDGNGSRYGAGYFMDEDVVLITFQYRLGAFGFLSTGDDIIHGNMAYKDQIEVLKWARDNGKYFNGDPNKVTIFGNSGGAMFVGLQLVSPMSSGLFHRAISQSGTALCFPFPENLNVVTQKGTMEEVGRVAGCDTADSQKYWECLVGKTAEELALIRTPKALYAPVLEDRTGGDESTKFLAEKPFDLLSSGRINAVPYIVGDVNAEYHTDAAVVLQEENNIQLLNDHFEDTGSLIQMNADLTTEEMLKVKEFYFGADRIWNGSLRNLGNLISDRKMVHPSYASARYHAKKADTYLYWITKPPYKSYFDKTVEGFPAKELGIVSHADELQYFFLYDGYPEIPKDDPEYFEFSKYLVKLWVHFARTGDATMDGVEWRKVNEYGNGFANSTYWLELTDTPVLTVAPQRRMGFWDEFDFTKIRYDW